MAGPLFQICGNGAVHADDLERQWRNTAAQPPRTPAAGGRSRSPSPAVAPAPSPRSASKDGPVGIKGREYGLYLHMTQEVMGRDSPSDSKGGEEG
ncbi:hypothetical protein [Actinomadura sp. 9N407]|uniref:hypothetical protein n=1 Tax=Actinomadura sp. 9N407 TaxID=3375154 RepID=UPI0037B5D34A